VKFVKLADNSGVRDGVLRMLVEWGRVRDDKRSGRQQKRHESNTTQKRITPSNVLPQHDHRHTLSLAYSYQSSRLSSSTGASSVPEAEKSISGNARVPSKPTRASTTATTRVSPCN
jgi:hypothetical protein